jgi:hypothetical protein
LERPFIVVQKVKERFEIRVWDVEKKSSTKGETCRLLACHLLLCC